ncbi:hypothetical protein P0L94_06575 [Microbacter sp. GSS18]|nr:hypothetical protein P0L94_06575 [Microbacter sp. GSS18]
MKTSTKTLLAAIVVSGFGLTGCAATSSTISQEEFLASANAICAEAAAEIEAMEWPDDGTEVFFIEEVVPNIRQQVADIRELGYPTGDEEVLAAILDDTEAVLDEIVAAGPGEVGNQANPFADVNQRMFAYGLDSCAG